jgi:hypothetical protein
MVRHGEVKPEQSGDRTDQTFGLPQCQAKHKPIIRAVVIARAE